MPFQFTFTKLRFFLLIVAMLVAALLIFAVGRVTAGNNAGANDSTAASGAAAPGGQSLNDKMAARNAQVQKVTAVQTLLGVPQIPGQAQATRGMYTATALAGMTPNANVAGGAPVAGATSSAPVGSTNTMAAAPAAATPNTAPAAGTPTTMPSSSASPAVLASTSAPAVPGGDVEPTPARLAFATASDPATEPFVLQFGAFRQQKDARDLQARLLQKGISAVIVTKVGNEDNLTWQTVRFGGYKDVNTALKAASEYGKQGFLAFVRPADSI